MRSRSVALQVGERLQSLTPGTVLLHASATPVVRGTIDWTRTIDLRDHVGIAQPELVYTEPAEETVRIISLRKALNHERKRFEQEFKNRLGLGRFDDG